MLKPLLLAFALAATASAHESCCAKKARLAKLRTIPDPNAEPPAVDAAGEPRLVANTSVAKPAGWDDEDDGRGRRRSSTTRASAGRRRSSTIRTTTRPRTRRAAQRGGEGGAVGRARQRDHRVARARAAPAA